MRIGVLIPTVTGREEYLALAAASHCPRLVGVDWFLSVQRDFPTCGEAWVAGVDELLSRDVDYLVITCDDFEARNPFYYANARFICDSGELPAPILFNAGEDVRWHSSVEDGEPGELARCTRSPHMLSAAQAEAIFALRRELSAFQYYGDYLLGDIGYRLGWPARVAPGFAFTHHWAQVGRHSDEENARDHDRYKAALARLDHLVGGRH